MFDRYFRCEGDRCENVVDARLLPSVSSSSGISPSKKGSLIDGMDTERIDSEPLSVEGAGTRSARVEAKVCRGSGWKVALVGVVSSSSFAFKPVLSPSVSLSSSNAASPRSMARSPWPGLGGTSMTLQLAPRRCLVSCGAVGGARLDAAGVTDGPVTLR